MTTPRNPALNDKRSAARIDNLRRLAAELQRRPMHVSDVCALLGVLKTGARGYLSDLADLLEVTSHANRYVGEHTYRLTADEAQVAAFLAGLGKPRLRGPRPSRAKPADTSRHFHFLLDDEPYHVKVSRVRIPQHFPLLAAFFGLAQPEQRV